MDFLVERHDGRVVAIEAKPAETPTAHDLRHLLWLRDQLGDDLADMVPDTVILTTGKRAYRRQDGVAVVSLAHFGPSTTPEFST